MKINEVIKEIQKLRESRSSFQGNAKKSPEDFSIEVLESLVHDTAKESRKMVASMKVLLMMAQITFEGDEPVPAELREAAMSALGAGVEKLDQFDEGLRPIVESFSPIKG